MGAINFYIPNDLMSELLQVENRSELITELLREHFNKGKPLKEIKEGKLKEAQTLIQEAEIIDKEIKEEREQREKQEKEMNNRDKKDEKEKEVERKRKQRETFREVFIRNWDIKKEEVEALLTEFITLLQDGKNCNIIEFMGFKQIKRKEKKEKNGII
jgi:hypothetical protein